jgi:hypothetical protein
MTLSNGYRTVDLARHSYHLPQPKTVVYERAILPTGLDSFVSRYRGSFFRPTLSLHKKNIKTHKIPWLFHNVSENCIAISDTHETWYDRYAIRVHPTTLKLNFLRRETTIWRACEPLRWDQQLSHAIQGPKINYGNISSETKQILKRKFSVTCEVKWRQCERIPLAFSLVAIFKLVLENYAGNIWHFYLHISNRTL